MPAQYPNAVKTFTSRNAGDVIQPSHINDLQDEVNAIEAGLLNATAPLNSSNSTVANLSVTGNSTIAGVQTVTGGRVMLTHSAAQGIANSAFTALNWDTETSDASGLHSTSANSSRITFVVSSGLWMVGANVQWDASSGGIRVTRIIKNDLTIEGATYIEKITNNANCAQSVSAMVLATSTSDYVTVDVFQSNGSTGSISSGAATRCWAFKL